MRLVEASDVHIRRTESQARNAPLSHAAPQTTTKFKSAPFQLNFKMQSGFEQDSNSEPTKMACLRF